MDVPAKNFIVEDSSFVISIIDSKDCFHQKAIDILVKLNKFNSNTLILIPQIVIYETAVTLVRKGIDKNKVEESIRKLLFLENVRCIDITESSLFRFCKNIQNISGFNLLKTSDFLIVSIAKDFSAKIITFDVQMRKSIKSSYQNIFCCDDIKDVKDETNDLIKSLE